MMDHLCESCYEQLTFSIHEGEYRTGMIVFCDKECLENYIKEMIKYALDNKRSLFKTNGYNSKA